MNDASYIAGPACADEAAPMAATRVQDTRKVVIHRMAHLLRGERGFRAFEEEVLDPQARKIL
jgi:hypothetical protein